MNEDPRLELVHKLVQALVTKSMYGFTQVLVTRDNLLIIIVDKTLLYMVPLNTNLVGPDIAFLYSDIFGLENPNQYTNNLVILNTIQGYRNLYNVDSGMYPLIFSNDDMRSNEEFETMLNRKATQGMEFYKTLSNDNSRYIFIPMFSSLLSVSKQDKVGIKVYDMLNGFNIIESDIYKKKINRVVRMFYRTMNI